jgi:hypothetical protein
MLLRRADGGILHSFAYSDDPPWPVEADGDGYSLVLINPRSNPDLNNPLNWRASAVAPGGSPGDVDTQSYAQWKSGYGNPADGADSDGDGLDTRLEYIMGGNPGVADQALRPQYSREADGSLTLTVRRSVLAEEIMPVVQSATDLGNWAPAANVTFVSTQRIAGTPATDLLTFRVVPPAGAGSFFLRFNFGP